MPFNEYHEIKLFMEQSFPSNNAADVISVFLCCCSSIFEVASFLSFERKRNLKKKQEVRLTRYWYCRWSHASGLFEDMLTLASQKIGFIVDQTLILYYVNILTTCYACLFTSLFYYLIRLNALPLAMGVPNFLSQWKFLKHRILKYFEM